MIGLRGLVDDGLLDRAALGATARDLPPDRVDFARAEACRESALRRAFAEFQASGGEVSPELASFRREADAWLADYALYVALAEPHGPVWTEWPALLRERDPAALARTRAELADEIAYVEFESSSSTSSGVASAMSARGEGSVSSGMPRSSSRM